MQTSNSSLNAKAVNSICLPSRTTRGIAARALRLKMVAELPKVAAPKDFKAPEPKALTITRPKEQALGLLSGSSALGLRLASGVFVLGWKIESVLKEVPEGKYGLKIGPFTLRDTSSVLDKAARPAEPIILYEFEPSPYCRKVREVCALLDLEVLYKPCPGAKSGFSDEMFEKTGRRTVPYLVDPNTDVAMFESEDQIDYLLSKYGPPAEDYDLKALWPMRGQFAFWTAAFAALARGFAGVKLQEDARPDNGEMQPLELWGYEPSPFVRPVREKLTTLGLPHVMVNCSRGSTNRDRMMAKTGRFQVPYLVDPNTGVEMYESCEIVEYLDEVYTV